MNNKSLSALVDQVRGVSYKPKDIHDTLNDLSIVLLRANNIFDGSVDFSDVIYIDRKRVSPSQILRRGDILVCASSGSKDLVGKAASFNCDGEYTFGAFCKVVRPKNIDDADYISVFFQSPKYRREIAASALGANINNIRNEHIDNLVINWPVKLNRDIIVSLLNQSKSIITLRKKQLQLFDELIKARFVEMFGNPISNPKGWATPLIEDVVAKEKNALKAGPFGSALKKEYYVNSGYKIYGQEQVIREDPSFGDYYISEEKFKQLENCAVQAGDVLISLVGTYGKLLIMPEQFQPGIINPRLMKITFDRTKVNPYYFKYYFQSEALKMALADNTHGGTMDILNLGIVRKLKMPLPPLKLQNDFNVFIKQVDKSKVAVQKSLNQAQLLFDSLMQQYFG